MTDSLYKIWGSTLTGTANAIRTKKGTSGDIDPANFESEILSIPSGGGSNLGTLNATSNGTYTPTSPLDGWNEVNVSVSGGISATSIDIVTELPSTLVEGAVYLIPNGEQIVPPLPLSIDTTMNRWAVTCEFPGEAVTFPYSLTVPKIKSSSKYYCFGAKAATTAEPQSFVSVPRTRSSYSSTMNFADSNTVTMPTYIYKYEPNVDTDWVDITSTITQTDWENNVVDHNMLHCFYSTYTMIRQSLNQISYETAWNAIDTNGRIIKQGYVDEYNVYFVESGVATNLGSHDLEWVSEYFKASNSKDIKFYDYDGTVLFKYIPLEFLALNSMPTPPTHTGMTFDGWNWTLTDAKDYVTNHGKIDIGATYTWSSPSTEIDIRLDNGRLSPYLTLGIDGTVTIDWGDSSATESITGSSTNTFIRTQHVYPQAGEYTITITPDTGTTYHVGNGNNKLLMKNASGNINNEDYVYVHSVINVRLGEGIIIGGECFRTYRNLKSVFFHDVPTLTLNCFRDCDALEYLCLPNNTTTITQNAFYNDCALKIIILQKEITTVYSEAFRYSFAEIVCMNNKDVTYGNDSFANMRTLNHIYIPDTQTALSSEMFRECFSLEEVIFSNALTTINSACFNYCYSINELNFPSSLDVINDTDAFGRCYGLSKVTFNKATMSKLGKNAFIYCNGLKEVNNLPEVTTYGIDIFRECYGIKELTPDSHMTSIPDGFVRGTALEEFVIPSGVTSIGNYSFYNIDTLASVTIPNGVTSIGEYCFNGLNSLVELNLPETVTDISRDAFEDCNGLKKINLPSQLTVLNSNLFKNCHALTDIIIPSSVTQIQGECFRYCYGLASIKFGSVAPPTLNNSNCFGGLPTDCIIYVPTGSLSDYTSAQYYPSSSTYTYVEY